MKIPRLLLLAGLVGLTTHAGANLLTNPAFSLGADGKEGWSTYLNVFDPTGVNYKYGTAWNTGTAVVGAGSVTLSMHPGWTDNGNGPADLGDVIENNFYADFGGAPAFAGQIVRFTGNFTVATPLAAGNVGQAFIKILDGGWGVSLFQTADVTASGGTFDLTAAVPTANMNAFQVGFLMRGPAASAGAMQISNLDLVVVPEPSAAVALMGVAALGLAWRRRRVSPSPTL